MHNLTARDVMTRDVEAVSADWMPIPASNKVKMPTRLRKKRKLSKKRCAPDCAVR